MINKNLSQKVNAYVVLMIILGIVLLGALGLIYWSNINQDTRPDIENVLTLEGKVTMKIGSCSAEALDPEEDVRRYAICDGGESIRIDGKIISTSTGGPGPGFYVDTDSIHLGDIVLVRYVVGEDNKGASLNCRQCSIVAIKS